MSGSAGVFFRLFLFPSFLMFFLLKKIVTTPENLFLNFFSFSRFFLSFSSFQKKKKNEKIHRSSNLRGKHVTRQNKQEKKRHKPYARCPISHDRKIGQI